jgi:murein DD-endopeptidase MepM/ murein hydrolase activator NlpD
MNKVKSVLLLLCVFAISESYAQRERGSIKKTTVVKPNNPYYKDTEKKKESFDFYEENVPKQILDAKFEKEAAPFKSFDTRSIVSVVDSNSVNPFEKISEGNKEIVEVVEEIQLGETSEEWVKVADYYSVWDERNIDPYNIDANEFEGPVVLNLEDRVNNRVGSSPTNQAPLTSTFKMRWGKKHTGVDLDIETGDPIYAAFDGIVRIAGWNGGGYGRFVVLRHFNGLETLYGHLDRIDVVANTLVKAGDMIGAGGNTGHSFGSHLHFETRYEGNPFNPQDVYIFPIGALKSDQLVLTKETFSLVRSHGTEEYSAGAKIKTRTSVFVTVRRGDTLSGIASRHGLSVSELARKNRISTSAHLYYGKKLRVK